MIAFRNFLLVSLLLVTGMGMQAKEKEKGLKNVLTREKCLENIRGTFHVDSVTRATDEDGTITAVHVVPTRGKNFVIGNGGNATITTIDTTALVNGLGGTTFPAVLSFEIAFDVFFDNIVRCKNAPTVVLGLEDDLGALGSPTAFFNTVLTDAGKVTTTGFQAKVFFVASGASKKDIYDLLNATLLANANLDFIAQCNKTKK